MGTEYYLVKPEKKEVFYLGKHFTCPDGITDRTYKKEANFIDYDCWDDFLWDFLKDNSFYFDNIKLEDTKDIIYKVYEWCESDKIYFDNDCREDLEWKDWKETGSLTDTLKEQLKSRRDLSEEFQNYLKNIEATVLESPSFESAIIGVTTDDRVVYSYDLMVDDIMDKDKVSWMDAHEFIENSTIRTLSSTPKSPIIIIEKENFM